MRIYSEQNPTFKPTWLYVKQHNKTGLKYFGKYTGLYLNSYCGSGVYWLRHLKKHGKDVSTIWSKLFINQNELIDFAHQFSNENKISESKDWANLKPENGLDGGFTPASKLKALTPEVRQKVVKKKKAKLATGEMSLKTAQYTITDPTGKNLILVGRSNLTEWCKEKGFTRGVIEWLILTGKPSSRGALRGWSAKVASTRSDWN